MARVDVNYRFFDALSIVDGSMTENLTITKKPSVISRRSLLHSGHVGSELFSVANEKHRSRSEQGYESYLNEIFPGITNPVLDSLSTVNGFNRNAYLNRIASVSPFINVHALNLRMEIEKVMATIGTATQMEDVEKHAASISAKYEGFRFLCEIAASDQYVEVLRTWVHDNPKQIPEMIVHNLTFDQYSIAIEACITIAYLVRRLHFNLLESMDLIIAAMVRMIAIAMVPLESYVASHHQATEKHADLEMVRNRTIPFHFVKFQPSFSEIYHRLVCVLYFSIADILFNVPCPKLIHFFECRIFRRKEMTRTILFNILHSVTINLPELRFEAERLSNLATEQPRELFQAINTQTPAGNFNASVWDDLPANMYIELMRVYNDQNAINNELITSMFTLLKVHAPIKLPIFEDVALATLKLFVQQNKQQEHIPITNVIDMKGNSTFPSISKKTSASKPSENPPSEMKFELKLPPIDNFTLALKDDEEEDEEEEEGGDAFDDYDDSYESKDREPIFDGEITRGSILPEKLPKFIAMPSADRH